MLTSFTALILLNLDMSQKVMRIILCRSGGKIRRPKSVQHRLHPTNSSTRLSVVKVPIKVDPEWQQSTTPPPSTNTFSFQFQQQQNVRHYLKKQWYRKVAYVSFNKHAILLTTSCHRYTTKRF